MCVLKLKWVPKWRILLMLVTEALNEEEGDLWGSEGECPLGEHGISFPYVLALHGCHPDCLVYSPLKTFHKAAANQSLWKMKDILSKIQKLHFAVRGFLGFRDVFVLATDEVSEHTSAWLCRHRAFLMVINYRHIFFYFLVGLVTGPSFVALAGLGLPL